MSAGKSDGCFLISGFERGCGRPLDAFKDEVGVWGLVSVFYMLAMLVVVYEKQ